MKTQAGHLYRRNGVWHVRYLKDGKPTTETTGTRNRRDAERRRAEIVAPYIMRGEVAQLEAVKARIEGRKTELTRLDDERNPPTAVAAAWADFMRSPARPDSGAATLYQYASEWKRFAKWMGAKHPEAKHLRDVTRQHAEAYAADLLAAKVSASTFNQHRNLLRLVWRVLADAARVTLNPWDGITSRKRNMLDARKRAVTPGQFDALLLATDADPDLHDLFTVLAWTGQRLVDGVTLRWGAVDFARGVVTVTPRKTARRQGKVVHIPLFPAAREVLDRREAGHPVQPAAYVFPELADAYERDHVAFTRRIRAAFERAGMITTEARADRKRSVTLFGAHSLRHFFVTSAASAGMPAAMIKSITGHATDGMLEHYQHIGADMAAEIAARMTAKALPAPVATEGTADGTPTLLGRFEALRATVAGIAARMDADTWQDCRRELIEATSPQPGNNAGPV